MARKVKISERERADIQRAINRNVGFFPFRKYLFSNIIDGFIRNVKNNECLFFDGKKLHRTRIYFGNGLTLKKLNRWIEDNIRRIK